VSHVVHERELLYSTRSGKMFRRTRGVLEKVPPGEPSESALWRRAAALAVLSPTTMAAVRGVRAPALLFEAPGPRRLSEAVDEGPIASDDLRRLASRLLTALHDLHRRGMVHLDMHPEVVSLDGPVFLDPGFAGFEGDYPLHQESSSEFQPVELAGWDNAAQASTDLALAGRLLYAAATANLPTAENIRNMTRSVSTFGEATFARWLQRLALPEPGRAFESARSAREALERLDGPQSVRWRADAFEAGLPDWQAAVVRRLAEGLRPAWREEFLPIALVGARGDVRQRVLGRLRRGIDPEGALVVHVEGMPGSYPWQDLRNGLREFLRDPVESTESVVMAASRGIDRELAAANIGLVGAELLGDTETKFFADYTTVFATFLSRLARPGRPLVLIVNAFHGLSPCTAGLIDRLMELEPPGVAVVMTTKRDPGETWRVTEVPRLRGPALYKEVREQLGHRQLEERVIRGIALASAGDLARLQEICRTLVLSGGLRPGTSTWRAMEDVARFSRLSLPEIVAKRLEHLRDDDLAALQLGALMGNHWRLEELADALGDRERAACAIAEGRRLQLLVVGREICFREPYHRASVLRGLSEGARATVAWAAARRWSLGPGSTGPALENLIAAGGEDIDPSLSYRAHFQTARTVFRNGDADGAWERIQAARKLADRHRFEPSLVEVHFASEVAYRAGLADEVSAMAMVLRRLKAPAYEVAVVHQYAMWSWADRADPEAAVGEGRKALQMFGISRGHPSFISSILRGIWDTFSRHRRFDKRSVELQQSVGDDLAVLRLVSDGRSTTAVRMASTLWKLPYTQSILRVFDVERSLGPAAATLEAQRLTAQTSGRIARVMWLGWVIERGDFEQLDRIMASGRRLASRSFWFQDGARSTFGRWWREGVALARECVEHQMPHEERLARFVAWSELRAPTQGHLCRVFAPYATDLALELVEDGQADLGRRAFRRWVGILDLARRGSAARLAGRIAQLRYDLVSSGRMPRSRDVMALMAEAERLDLPVHVLRLRLLRLATAVRLRRTAGAVSEAEMIVAFARARRWEHYARAIARRFELARAPLLEEAAGAQSPLVVLDVARVLSQDGSGEERRVRALAVITQSLDLSTASIVVARDGEIRDVVTVKGTHRTEASESVRSMASAVLTTHRIHQGTGSLPKVAVPILGRDGVLGVLCVTRDAGRSSISDATVVSLRAAAVAIGQRFEHEALEDAWYTARESLDELMEAIPDLVALLDRDGRVLRVRPATPRLIDFDAQDAEGARIEDVLADLPRDLISDLRTSVENSGRVERTVELKGNNPRWVDVRIRVRPNLPIQLTVRDVTERERARKLILEDEGRRQALIALRESFHSSRDWASAIQGACRAVSVQALAGRVVFIPRAKLASRSPEASALEGGHVVLVPHIRLFDRFDGFEEEAGDALAALIFPVLGEGERGGVIAGYFDTPHRFSSGESELARMLMEFLRSAAEQVELDELRKQNEENELERGRREARSTLAGYLAHSFNNSLFHIRGHAMELLEGQLEDGASETVAAIVEGANDLGALVDRLSALSEDVRSVPEPLGIAEVRDLFGEIGVVGSFHGHIHADPRDLTRLFGNLAELCGVKAVRARVGESVVSVTSHSGYDRLSPGVYAVFEVFDRMVSGDAEYNLHGGSEVVSVKGDGLALLRGAVESMSRRLGGLAFVDNGYWSVWIPRVAGSVVRPPATPPEEASGQLRVLVVDDEPLVCRMVSRLLARLGHQVESAGSGDAAIELLSAGGSVDLVLTDVVMPGTDGRKLAHWIAEHRPEASLVFMSGHAEDMRLRTEFLDRGVPILRKPFVSADLKSALRNARSIQDVARA